MANAYRLNDLGFAVPAGAQVLQPEVVASLGTAAAILDAAQARARAIVAEAEEAHEQRRREGYAEGTARAERDALARLIGENAELDAGLRACEADLARIVAACTRKLVSSFDDQALAEAAVRDALRQMRREKRAELRVAPEQFAAFSATVGALKAEMPDMELLDVISDAALAAPRIVLESRIGRVEADVAAELRALDDILRRAGARFAEFGA